MKPIDILNETHLKRTSCREGILKVMLESNEALSENEIRERLEGNYDRTTFYRSFKTLEENHIVHKIIIDASLTKYALEEQYLEIGPLHSEKETTSMHAHFHCQQCNTVKCIPLKDCPTPVLPEGYLIDHFELIVKGTCQLCNLN